MKYPRVAIATTLCNAAHILPSFVRYHLLAGFDHLFLFFDDAKDEALYHRMAQVPKTSCFIQGPLLQANWKKVRHRVDPQVYDFVWKEAMARQQLNVAVAIEACLIQGIDWLLHIDVDEAFYSSHLSVEDHFRMLDEQDVAVCRYLNHEAIPESFDILDFFEATTLFKKSPRFISAPKDRDPLLASLTQIPPRFFHFYSNGKVAAKVTESLKASGVHNFDVPEDAKRVTADRSQVVLHYPCCGFSHFWDKYNTLGSFGDAWYERIDIRSRTGSTHLDSRDVVSAGAKEEAAAFYRRRFMIDAPESTERLIQKGYCTRITHVRDRLKSPHKDQLKSTVKSTA